MRICPRSFEFHRKESCRLVSWFSAVATLALAANFACPAQTLAHPGLVGNGIDTRPWWQHAVFYKTAETGGSDSAAAGVDFKAISSRLDALRSLGVDALLLPAPELPEPGTNGPMPDLDDLDNLLRGASSHDIRVVLTIRSNGNAANLEGLARFWLNRGVAGLHVSFLNDVGPDQAQADLKSVRKLASSVPGRRIVISDADVGSLEIDQQEQPRPASGHSKRGAVSAAQLEIAHLGQLQSLNAGGLRTLLTQTVSQPNIIVDLGISEPAAASSAAAVALLTEPAALIEANAGPPLAATVDERENAEQSDAPAQTAPPPQLPPGVYGPYVPYVAPPKPHKQALPKPVATDPLTNWYRKLISLRTQNATIRSGKKIFLDFDSQDVLAWVYRPASLSVRTPPVVVVCNLSGSQMQLSLAEGLKKLDLHGSYLRPLARSYGGVGPQDVSAVTVPPFGVFIGDLRR